jgi:hypothetical protein
MFHFHAKTKFRKLVHSRAFKGPLKYISCCEMARKLAFMVHQHVIEFWVKNVLFIEDFLFNKSICIILQYA